MRVIPLRPECYREAGAMLARAFADDPLTTYTIPDPARRQRVLAWAHERWATFLGPLGGFFTTENIEAVAGWIRIHQVCATRDKATADHKSANGSFKRSRH